MGVYSCSVFAYVLGVLVFASTLYVDGGSTSSFVRKVEKTIDMPLDADVFITPPGYNAPQQVHITQGDHVGKAMLVTWVTMDEPGSNTVIYWPQNSKKKRKAEGMLTKYSFFNYTSGFIHHCNLTHLRHDTKYFYSIGLDHTKRTFWFTTPPEVGPDVPYTFGLIGDLGQSYDSNITLTHYEMNPTKGETVLFVGDLSYADNYPNHDNRRWDSWGRFTERSTAYQPWIWTAGNHEIDFVPEIGEDEPFKPYTHRYPVPYKSSQSTAPFWYSIKRASSYIIILASYSAYGKYTPQYKWLEKELPKVNRTETPWLIVVMHSPWYNSYNYHYMEGETMRVMYEPWFIKYKVDVVFAGHVHAYERSERISNVAYNIVNGICKPIKDQSAPVYITIGDGGNLEGLATNMTEPPVEALPTPTELSSLTGPVDDTSKKTLEDATSANGVQTDAGAGKPAEENNISAETGASEISQSEEHDVPQPSIEEIAPGQEPSEDVKQADASVDGEKVEKKDTAEKEGETGVAPTPAFGSGFGFDQSASGGFPGMGFSGDFNQMQMMMAMQNGMAPGGFGNFPMMGMPGMNMDPMTMQNMMMNGGFGGAGMGMNGMNMGMGMGNFDGGIGAGFNNGWNSQQSWNVGPDNFNHPNAAGMGPGDYGANNSGFPQNAAGFNQGNFGRANQYNDYQNSYSQGYQGRGRGRGRGGWHQNRGGHGHGFNDHSQHLQQQVGQGQQSSESYNENDPMSTGPKGETESGSGANVDEFGRELRQDTPKNEAENGIDGINIQDAVSSATKDGKEQQVNSEDVSQHDTSGTGNDDFTPQPIQSLEANESAAFAPMPMIGDGFNAMSLVDPNMRYLSHPRGGFLQSRGGRGGSFHAMQPPFVKPVDVPINAPTGPKAMREGPKPALPNIRTHGFSIAGKASASARGSVSGISVAPESATQERGRTRSPSLEKERDRSQSRSKSKDHKRDRSRERRHRRRHRSASRSRSEDEEESERRREKRRERRRRHEEEADLERDSNESKAEKKDDDRRRDDENRSRSASPQESKRSSHRSSRRDRDKYRDRERDDDKHRSSSHKHRSSHRSHRDERSRSRERERSERDREREHRHRQSRHASRDAEDRVKGDTPVDTPTEPNLSSRKSSLISSGLNGIEIKGASSRNKSSRDINLPLNIPTGPKGGERDREREREKDRSSRHSESHRSRRESERNNTSSRDQEKDRPEKKKEEVDPHTLEREARNRERLLKEAQRIAGLTSALSVGRKRSRDEVDDGSGRKGRKKGRRAGGEDNDEARIARLEAERESSRWA